MDGSASRGEVGVARRWTSLPARWVRRRRPDVSEEIRELRVHLEHALAASERPGAPTAAQREPRILELRIHGVNNTAPHHLLDLQASEVEQVAGDHLGSFWRPTPESQERARPSEPGHVPPGAVREAYSWGGMARTTPAFGSGTAAVVVNALGRLGWTLLLPFGLVNVAFWSRRLDRSGQGSGWQRGLAAWLIRVFALCLTLLMLTGVSVVSLDLVATQCFADGHEWCAVLPSAIDVLGGWTHNERLAAMSVVPVAVLLLVMAVSSVSRVRYEQYAAVPPVAGADDPRHRRAPFLATPGFWSNARLTYTVGWLHVGAGLCFLVVITGAHQVFGTGTSCTRLTEFVSDACARQVAQLPPTGAPFLGTSALAFMGLLTIPLLLIGVTRGASTVTRESPDGSGADEAWHLARTIKWAVLSCVVVFAVHLVLLVALPHETQVEVPLLGLTTAPVVLTLIMLLIATSAVGWRSPRRGDAHVTTTRRRYQAWRGTAPAVFLLLALGFALTLASLLVVGTGNWINQSEAAGSLLRDGPGMPGQQPPDPACAPECPPDVMVPAVFVWFGAAVLVAFGVVVLCAAVAFVKTPKGLGPAGGTDDGGTLQRPGLVAALRGRRRMAALAHRAEPLVGCLAIACAATIGGALAFTLLIAVDVVAAPPQMRGEQPEGGEVVYAWLVDRAAWGLAVLALLLIGGLVGGAALGKHRPLGLVWDLICFLPRAGHPFGPPCYAERVVPELVRRYNREQEDGGAQHVLVSAHSLGAVLAVASIFATCAERGPSSLERLSLVTYGTQLRPYFGRMFPELLGPDVLGTSPCRCAGLGGDPWRSTIDDERSAARPRAADPGRTDLVHLLGGADGGLRWVNLWRRTDYLGFPVDRYVGSDIDRPAEELDESGYLPVLGTHGGYTRVPAYAAAAAHVGPPPARTADAGPA